MELTESVNRINQQLINFYGIDTVSGKPIWRVVFSEDEVENRFGTYDDYDRNGIFQKSVTEWRLVPKYKQWIHAKYLIERLTVVPEINQDEVAEKLSYEPIYVFEDKIGNYLPPKIEAAKFVIDTLYAAMGKSSLAKYKEDAIAQASSGENYERRIDMLQQDLFGHNERGENWLVTGEGISVPHNYVKREGNNE